MPTIFEFFGPKLLGEHVYTMGPPTYIFQYALVSAILPTCFATVYIGSFAQFPLLPFEIICNPMQNM